MSSFACLLYIETFPIQNSYSVYNSSNYLCYGVYWSHSLEHPKEEDEEY